MARLNEAAAPPAESVDALKRRFVRQNRELTKANTTQSLRIRTLELETSRLLAENLALRSQIIALQHRSRRQQSRACAVLTVKSRLESTLEELGRLVGELGDASAADQVLPGGGGGGGGSDTVEDRGGARSPGPRNWRNTLRLSDVAGGAQAQGQAHGHGTEASASGRLPVIVEDKDYPRRTMRYVPLLLTADPPSSLSMRRRGEKWGLFFDVVSIRSGEELVGLLAGPGPGTVNATAAAADSPDLGPPPVAHFESEEVPIRFDPGSVHATADRDAELEFGNPVLSANLETRKRRKDGGSNASEAGAAKGDGAAYTVEKSRLSASSSARMEESGACQSSNLNLNPSAKRKLSVRDGEEAAEEGSALTGRDEFVYNRRPGVGVVEDGARERENKQDGDVRIAMSSADPAPRGVGRSGKVRDGTAAITGASVRKALEPKSANTDPLSSPTKTAKHATINNEKIADAKRDTARKGRDRDRHRERDGKPTPTTNAHMPSEPKPKHEPTHPNSLPLPHPPTAEIAPDLPPETPAPLDLFSPHSSTEPSATRPDSRDTPPPTDLSASTTDTFNPSGRASRRPRAAGVSYAEPNLRDKMRRPTKALADAVGAEERVQRALNGARAGSETRQANDGGAADGGTVRTVVIKKENALSDAAWKLLPAEPSQRYRAGAMASPLDDRSVRAGGDGNVEGKGNGDGSGDGELPPSVMTGRRHRGSSVHVRLDGADEGSEKYASVAGTTIAALVAGTARKRERMAMQQRQEQRNTTDDDKEKVLDEPTEAEQGVDIYAFHASEPTAAAAALVDDEAATGAGTNTAASRTSRRHSTMSSSSRPSSRSSGRRRGTLGLDGAQDGLELGLGSAARKGEGEGDGGGGGRVAKARSVVDLKKKVDVGVDVMGMGMGVEVGVGTGRADRVAARRRSMML